MGRRVKTPLGPARIDLDELCLWTADEDVAMILVETVRTEVEATLAAAVVDAHPREPPRTQQRIMRVAETAWPALAGRFQFVSGAVDKTELNAARRFFKENALDLRTMMDRPKNPIPGTNDLKILLRTNRLGGRPQIISRDSHFLAYRTLIQKHWNVGIIDTRELPMMLEQWRAA